MERPSKIASPDVLGGSLDDRLNLFVPYEHSKV
jgi:hypothetical protein